MAKRTKEELDKAIMDMSDKLEFSLSELEGIGPKRLATLNGIGVYKAEDLIIQSPKELADATGLTMDACKDMIEAARKFLNKNKVVENSFVNGEELLAYRGKKIIHLQTGASNIDSMLGGGYESGVITEFYGKEGSGKTQFCTQAAALAQLPVSKGGLSSEKEKCTVIYIDTENSFRPSRLSEIILERELVPVKPQTKDQIKKGLPKEPLDAKAEKELNQYLSNVIRSRPANSGHQQLIIDQLGSFFSGDCCKTCYSRRENHTDEHEFTPIAAPKLLIVDSIINVFRLDYLGRSNLSERQMAIAKHVRHISRLAEINNIVCLVSNQIMMDPGAGAFGDPTRPVGGQVMGHVFKHRIYLQKPGKKIVAKLVDSADHKQGEGTIILTSAGAVNGE